MVSSPNLGDATTRGRVAYVLDDEAPIGAFVCDVLIASGFEARQFADPFVFLAAVKANAPHLTIVDLALGHSDAVEVIRQLETIRFQGGVLLMSGRHEARSRKSSKSEIATGLQCSRRSRSHLARAISGSVWPTLMRTGTGWPPKRSRLRATRTRRTRRGGGRGVAASEV